VNPVVAFHLIGPRGETIDEIEKRINRRVYVRAREDMHTEKFEITAGESKEIEAALLPFRRDAVVECEVVRNPYSTLPRSTAWLDGYLLELSNGGRYIGQTVKARLTDIRRSWAVGDVMNPSRLDKTRRS